MYATAPIAFNHCGQTLKFAQKVETPPMETVLKCTQPALALASDHLIELVDRGQIAIPPQAILLAPSRSGAAKLESALAEGLIRRLARGDSAGTVTYRARRSQPLGALSTSA